MERKEKKQGFDYWKETLHSAKYVVAPMVDQSELAWRMLSRRYGADLCYTPMLHAWVFAKDVNYRKESLQSCSEDRPLIIQFCANDPAILLKAAQLAVKECKCDGIDLNLGCPQVIAKRGHYGAFLQDEWDLVEKMVKICHENLQVPITCKIRILENVERTVCYAKMLEAAGCQLLTVHGRTRDQKGRHTGLADWSYIKAVREAVSIPVYANGNIQYLPDVGRCMEDTGVQGVMIAEGNLHNPALFDGKQPLVWDMALEYLDLVEKYPCPLSYIRGHIFKLFHHALNIHRDVREIVASGKSSKEFRDATLMLKEICQEPMKRFETEPELYTTNIKLPLPYWVCQPYVRPSADEVQDEAHKEFRLALNLKRAADMEKIGGGDTGLSKNKLKKMLKNPNKNFNRSVRDAFLKCKLCPNPKGTRCEHGLCRHCCRNKSNEEILDCKGHNTKKKTIAEREKLADVASTESRVPNGISLGSSNLCGNVASGGDVKKNQKLDNVNSDPSGGLCEAYNDKNGDNNGVSACDSDHKDENCLNNEPPIRDSVTSPSKAS